MRLCVTRIEDIQVFSYNLEALLRCALPKIEKEGRETLLKQQFVDRITIKLRRQLLQRPIFFYEDAIAAEQQLDYI